MPLCCTFSPERPPDASGSPQQFPTHGRSPRTPDSRNPWRGVGVSFGAAQPDYAKEKINFEILMLQVRPRVQILEWMLRFRWVASPAL